MADFSRHFRIEFREPELLRLALTHRSYLSVTGKGPRESNERLEFLGDSVLGLVTSEFLYRSHPDEHEGQLTKTKSLLVSKAILSRRALSMGLGRFVLMSHSEVEAGGRQRLSILADAFESVIGAIYLDQGFEAAREFIHYWLLRDSREIVADKRHRNYKSHLQEYVQSTFRTHPVYRIRSQMGPDHSKLFLVEVMVGRRVLGEGRGHNKKEAEQAAARDALEKVEKPGSRREAERSQGEPQPGGAPRPETGGAPEPRAAGPRGPREERRTRRHEPRGGRPRAGIEAAKGRPAQEGPVPPRPGVEKEKEEAEPELEPAPSVYDEDDLEEVGRPEGPIEERRIDLFGMEAPAPEPALAEPPAAEPPAVEAAPQAASREPEAAPSEPGPAEAGEEPEATQEAEEEGPEPGVTPAESGPPGEPRYGRRRGRRR